MCPLLSALLTWLMYAALLAWVWLLAASGGVGRSRGHWASGWRQRGAGAARSGHVAAAAASWPGPVAPGGAPAYGQQGSPASDAAPRAGYWGCP